MGFMKLQPLTDEQMQHLQQIRTDHQKMHNKRQSVGREGLFKILFYYIKYRKAWQRRLKHRKVHREYWNKNIRYKPIFHDCPLSRGEYYNAIRYGLEQGYLKKPFIGEGHEWTKKTIAIMTNGGKL